MSSRFSFWMLILLLAAAGWFFFEIIEPFLPPMFLAAVLAMIFRPAYESVTRKCRGRTRVAAALSTLLILLAVILPIALALIMAGREVLRLGQEQIIARFQGGDPELAKSLERLRELTTPEDYQQMREAIRAGEPPSSVVRFPEDSEGMRLLMQLEHDYDATQLLQGMEGFRVAELADPEQSPILGPLLRPLRQYLPEGAALQIRASVSTLMRRLFENLYGWTRNAVSDVINIVVGFVIMSISLYYFLADGPGIIQRGKELLPLESEDRDALLKEYTVVCRAVVFATLIAALLQGVLLGIGLWIAGVDQVFVLSSIAVITSMIPFIGAAGVYIPVALWLVVQGSYIAGIGLGLYGALIISTSDNVVRMVVVGDRSHLHPLAVLVTALGGLKYFGLLGIFIGPLVAALFYSLLKITHRRINEMEGRPPGMTGELLLPPGKS